MTVRVALITGAAQGLGRAFSERLLQRGAKVCLSDVNVKQGAATLQELQKLYGDKSCVFTKCDVTKQSEYEDTFRLAKDAFGTIDLVINNAGILNENEWEKSLQINLFGVVYGTKLAIEHMRRDRGGLGGHVINIASMAGLTAVPFGPVYAAAKHGVVGFSRSYGNEYVQKKFGIRVNTLCPAYAKTEILKLKEDSVLFQAWAEASLKEIGVMQVSKVVEGMEMLLDDPQQNGAVLMMSERFGTKYMKYKI